MKNERVKKHLAERALEAKEQWEKYSSNPGTITTLSCYGNHIQGVPA